MPNNSLSSFLTSLKVFPILGETSHEWSYVPLDLSLDNPSLEHVNVGLSADLKNYIWSYLEAKKADVAYGGYLEKRGIYKRSNYFKKSNPQLERNIHLGLDIWANEGTPIYAPLEATVHSFNNNTNHGDYGPTLILEHNIEGLTFFTLYGHLSLESLNGKFIGERIATGQRIATLGSEDVNGDYPPHLHFQIIKNMNGHFGDYPGVSNEKDLEFYKTNCPDPNLLLNLH